MNFEHSYFWPKDLDEQLKLWPVNCGPAALAAIAEKSLADVRPHLGAFEKRGYMNPSHMIDAMNSMLVHHGVVDPFEFKGGRALAFIQWCGNWDNAPARVQYKHTHWVAIRKVGQQSFYFDINNESAPWLEREDWHRQTATRIMDAISFSTGSYYVRSMLQVVL